MGRNTQLRWCDRHEVSYIVGLAKNKRLNRLTASLQNEAAACFAATGQKVRWFTDLHYGARSWDKPRRVIAKIEYSAHGVNPRYVVTNLQGTELAKAYVGTIRLKLFKIGAVILTNTRRIRFLLASGCPCQELYFLAAKRLASG